MNVSILGGGAWGTTLAQTLTDNGNLVVILDINIEFVEKACTSILWYVHPIIYSCYIGFKRNTRF
jgi:glycerol-3-phosphate dehydrogenase (NAD(P)+)